MVAPEWFPTRRRFDDALEALHDALTLVAAARLQHTYDLALIERLEGELARYRKTERTHLRVGRRGD